LDTQKVTHKQIEHKILDNKRGLGVAEKATLPG